MSNRVEFTKQREHAAFGVKISPVTRSTDLGIILGKQGAFAMPGTGAIRAVGRETMVTTVMNLVTEVLRFGTPFKPVATGAALESGVSVLRVPHHEPG